MLLLEKVIKLMDDFHFDVYRNHVKNISIRSYYPLALIDVIDRSPFITQSIERLCNDVYSEYDEGTHKKFLQLTHYTFRLTSFLAKNYPDYLHHNISKIQFFINSGELEKGVKLLEILIEVSAKVEDFNTEFTAQQILAQHYILSEKRDLAIKCYDRVESLQAQKKSLWAIQSYIHTNHALRSSHTISSEDLDKHLEFFEKYKGSKSFYVQFLQKVGTYFFLHLARDKRFYDKAVFEGIVKCEKEYEKNDYVITPYLSNYIHVLQFLKLYHFIKIADPNEIIENVEGVLENRQDLQFWNSYFNMTEFSSIGILSNFYADQYFFSYEDNHLDKLSEETKKNFELLKTRCEEILENTRFTEKYIVRYVNLSTIYALLLSCGDEKDIKKSTRILEGLLINYQQISFHSLTDSIYSILILGYFSLKDFDNVDKCYRRFNKNLKNKTVDPRNSFIIQSIFYISKWLISEKQQYLKKLNLVFTSFEGENLSKTKKDIAKIIKYFDIPTLSQ